MTIRALGMISPAWPICCSIYRKLLRWTHGRHQGQFRQRDRRRRARGAGEARSPRAYRADRPNRARRRIRYGNRDHRSNGAGGWPHRTDGRGGRDGRDGRPRADRIDRQRGADGRDGRDRRNRNHRSRRQHRSDGTRPCGSDWANRQHRTDRLNRVDRKHGTGWNLQFDGSHWSDGPDGVDRIDGRDRTNGTDGADRANGHHGSGSDGADRPDRRRWFRCCGRLRERRFNWNLHSPTGLRIGHAHRPWHVPARAERSAGSSCGHCPDRAERRRRYGFRAGDGKQRGNQRNYVRRLGHPDRRELQHRSLRRLSDGHPIYVHRSVNEHQGGQAIPTTGEEARCLSFLKTVRFPTLESPGLRILTRRRTAE